jgi:Ca2+-binding EF-hand superfamily protein
MEKQTVQQQDGHSKNGHQQTDKDINQKLHADAYPAQHPQNVYPSGALRDPERTNEQVKVDYVEQRMAMFKKMDLNHDGKISIDELVKYDRAATTKDLHESTIRESKYLMASLDLNHDGKVTLQEYEKARAWTHETKKQLDAEFKAKDAKGDGVLTFSDIKAFNTKQDARMNELIVGSIEAADRTTFDSIDVNHDGKLSLAEFIAPNISIPPIWGTLPINGSLGEASGAASAAEAIAGGDAAPPAATAPPPGYNVADPSPPPTRKHK